MLTYASITFTLFSSMFSKHPILKIIEYFEQMFPIWIFCFKIFLKFFGQVYYYYPSPSSKTKILFKVNKKLQRSTLLVCIAQKFKALPEMTFCYLSVQTFSALYVCVCVCVFQMLYHAYGFFNPCTFNTVFFILGQRKGRYP